MASCGLDFGTSNTTLGHMVDGGPRLVALEDGASTIPSAVFFRSDNGAMLAGRAAVAAYTEDAPGRLLRSLKSVLGSSLVDETTRLGRSRVRFRDVIARFLAEVKRRAEEEAGAPIDSVVHGRPVHFVDNDRAGDARAEATLREIASGVGFRHVSFQLEPIAAALDYEQSLVREELALIADIGGGTSDFSIVRLGPDRHARPDRAGDVLANDGIRVGGTDFDRELSLGLVMPHLGYRSPMKRPGLDVPSAYFHDLATWSRIPLLYDPSVLRQIRQVQREAERADLLARLSQVIADQRGHTLAIAVEEAKIGLSFEETAFIPLDWLEPDLAIALARSDLTRITDLLAARIAERVGICLAAAGVPGERVDAVFLTGGSTRLAHVRSGILAALPQARVVDGDTFGSVGLGLTLEAARQYGPG